MNIRTLYLDTSVIGGCFDHQWQESTTELFRQAASGLYQLAASVVTARELEEAPLEVQQFFATTFLESEQILELTAEAETLAQAYVAAGVVKAKYVDDARHVEAGFNAVNRLHNYPEVRILSPLELIYESDPDQTV